jgi:uncharacterized protein
MSLSNIQRATLESFSRRLAEPVRLIQVLWGPRQVGKTTLAQQASTVFSTQMQGVAHYASSDAAPEPDANWLQAQWQTARLKTQAHVAKTAASQGAKASITALPQGLLILDEIQRVRDWPRHVKALWDADRASSHAMHVVLLGSSPAAIQKGISESLAGRFEQTWLGHWSLAEVQTAFGATVDEYVYYGGYPGAYALKNQNARWRAYVRDALLETAISRDVLQLASVEKPALLRQLAHLTTHYSGHLLSYTKMLGSLQDAGNATTLAHYLHLLEAAGLMTGLQKFAGDVARQRGSIPKLLVLNTALISASHELNFMQARQNAEHWGRLVESCVGAHLWNVSRSSADLGSVELTYWRERSSEVDFCISRGNRRLGIEVKSGKKRERAAGLAAFATQFGASSLIVGTGGLALEEFLKMPPEIWLDASA